MRIRPTFAALAIAPLLLALTPPMAMGAGRSPSPVVNTIRNGKGAPKSSLGIDGDFYIDTRSLVLYGPKKKGKWPAPRNLQGPTGASGSDGKSGSDGRTITSASTTTGPQGISGPQGVSGPQGISGPQGVPGIAGSKGETGTSGSPGPAGAAGSNGPPGSAGAQGPQGPQGVQGAQGSAGVTEVIVVDIPQWILSSALPVSYANSQNFGVFEAGKSYLLHIFISCNSVNSNLVLGLDLLSQGSVTNFSYSRNYARYATYSTNQWLYGFEVRATLVVGTMNTTMSVRVIDGLGDSGAAPLTLTGKAYITPVGLIR